MFIFTWLFDKLGYMPKISIDSTWTFPISKPFTPQEFEEPVKKTVKKATTRKSTKK
jgi:hypothetical protein